MVDENVNLIRKIAWTFARRSDMEFEELFSEAYLAVLEASDSYDEKTAKESTFIWHVATNRLNTFTTKERRWNATHCEMPESFDPRDHQPSPEELACLAEQWSDLISRLSPDAREVFQSIIASPTPYLPTDKPRSSRKRIRQLLEWKGWSNQRIRACFDNIQIALQEPMRNEALQ